VRVVETRTKVALVAAVALFALGFGAGQGVQPEPTPPSPPPAEVVIKYRDRVETVEVPGELPEVCLDAIASMEALDAEQNRIGEASGDMILQAAELNKTAVIGDTNGMVLAQEAMRGSVDQLNSATINTLALIDDIEMLLDQCESAAN